MAIKIVRPGALTTVQDCGRFGYMHLGFSQCGAMDIRALKTANILLSNDPGAAALEMTVTGIAALFTENTAVCLSGAPMEAAINGKPIEPGRVYEVFDGDVLICGRVKSGVRSYLAVCGGIDVPEFLGSRSTDIKARCGGFCGRALKTGDELSILPHGRLKRVDERRAELIKPSRSITLRAVSAAQEDMFTKDDINLFYSQRYTVSPDSNRMGVRLSGEPLKGKNGMDIISDGIAPGSVQVPESGLPIILAADRQSTGGYAKIASVICADLPLLAQVVPGGSISFRHIGVKEALLAARRENEKLMKLREYIDALE